MSLANSVIGETEDCCEHGHGQDFCFNLRNPVSALTLHQCSVCAAVVVEVAAVGVVQTIVSQTVCVAKTLQDGVHEALQKQTQDRT